MRRVEQRTPYLLVFGVVIPGLKERKYLVVTIIYIVYFSFREITIVLMKSDLEIRDSVHTRKKKSRHGLPSTNSIRRDGIVVAQHARLFSAQPLFATSQTIAA
jgi:hypothetical protein